MSATRLIKRNAKRAAAPNLTPVIAGVHAKLYLARTPPPRPSPKQRRAKLHRDWLPLNEPVGID